MRSDGICSKLHRRVMCCGDGLRGRVAVCTRKVVRHRALARRCDVAEVMRHCWRSDVGRGGMSERGHWRGLVARPFLHASPTKPARLPLQADSQMYDITMENHSFLHPWSNFLHPRSNFLHSKIIYRWWIHWDILLFNNGAKYAFWR